MEDHDKVAADYKHLRLLSKWFKNQFINSEIIINWIFTNQNPTTY